MTNESEISVTGADSLTQSLLRIAGVLVDEENLVDTLHLIATLATDAVPTADGVSVTLSGEDGLTTAAHTDDAFARVDSYQYDLGEGPCLRATREGETFRVDTTEDEVHWPRFAPHARGEGVACVLSLPLLVRGKGLGALNLYSRSTAPFTDDDERVAAAFALRAATTLANQLAYIDVQAVAGNLQQALVTRDLIGQAKGIIIARRRCSSEEAFDLLRRTSQHDNRKLRDVAQEVVDRARR